MSTLHRLDQRLEILLPKLYQGSDEPLTPEPMRSAGLKFDSDGRVAWDEIWGSFCDLAMAGGPPHKGALLEPGSRADIDADPDRYRHVVHEICRGVTMVADLFAHPAPDPGWIRVSCFNDTMAAWLLRAIVMENVSARAGGKALDLPAAPAFRLEKEIKNVITVIAKTCHYWTGHIPRDQQREIAELFAEMTKESPLIEPLTAASAWSPDEQEVVAAALAESINGHTGLSRASHRYAGWVGFDCPSVTAAVWMMRSLVASNVLSRREARAFFVPVNPTTDPAGVRVASAVARVHALAKERGLW